ncbi:MAG TPA: cupin domain-containing protein [Thermoanaerobaculia bacterium]
MKLFQRTVVIAVAAVGLFVMSGVSAKKSAKDMVVAADQMHFQDAMPGISKATLWGDSAKGPYVCITRFAKGTKVGWHQHPHDIKAVVISGTMLYDNGSGEKRLGPGSFLQERASVRHTAAATPDSDLEFLEVGAGPFGIRLEK